MSKFERKVKGHKRKIAYDPEQGEKILQSGPVYVGSPLHKRNPGNFGLKPPSSPAPKKNLCDDVAIFDRKQAQQLLEEGFKRGFFSTMQRNGWPRNVWALWNDLPLEARLDQDNGTYHGFPMSSNDPLYAEIMKEWKNNA